MRFNSLEYVAFLTVVCTVYYMLPHRHRWALLLAASYYFYMSWNPKLVLLIAFTTLVSFFGAQAVEKAGDQKTKNFYKIISVGACLSTLFAFKYLNFFNASFNYISTALKSGARLPILDIILPVGISFYTFQTLSYVIDVGRGRMPAVRHLGKYALYVSFFPQLVAGPIERATNLLPQFEKTHNFNQSDFTEGLRKILAGMFKKVVIADTFAVYVNNVYNNLEGKAGLNIMLATLFFGIQVYCDFSGYSDIATGSAKLLGFDLMQNFKAPYLSTSVKQFWRRWHISLTSWFTDYVYIPLGGSRCKPQRHLANLLIVFALSGLWHGANYTYVLWGIYHGLLLCAGVFALPHIEKMQSCLNGFSKKLFVFCRWCLTVVLVNIGWIFFRANSLADLKYIFGNITKGINILRLGTYLEIMGMSFAQLFTAVLLIALLLIFDSLTLDSKRRSEKFNSLTPALRYGIYWLAGIAVIYVFMSRPIGTRAEFIYFQF